MMNNVFIKVTPVADDLLTSGDIPGLTILAQKGDQTPQGLYLGTDAAGQLLTADTLFPVASVTKLATALVILRLADSGRLSIDDSLSRFLPDAQVVKDSSVPITLRMLLSHTGGLPGDLAEGMAPYAPGLDWPTLSRAFLATPLERPPLTEVLYSNCGYALLALAAERVTGQPFTHALKEWVLSPLGIEGYFGEEPPVTPAAIRGDWGKHAGTELEPYNSAFWRSLAMPYGSLVTTAAGTMKLVQAYAGRPAGFLSTDLLTEARHDQTRRLPGRIIGLFDWKRNPWGLGVELRGLKLPHAVAPAASPESFGHVGASGAMAWVDPAMDGAWVILGPRLFQDWWPHFTDLTAAILAGF